MHLVYLQRKPPKPQCLGNKKDSLVTVLLFIKEMTPTSDGMSGINSIAQHPLMWLHCNNQPATSLSLPCSTELLPSVPLQAAGQIKFNE